MLVEVWSDVVCPWCRAGISRFETAVQQLGWEDDVEIVFRAFELPVKPGSPRPPTFDAHRLCAWALATAGSRAQVALERRLMRGVFEEDLDPSDHARLAAAAAEVGLDADAARAVLASDAHADDVRAAEAEATELEIFGVPAFRFERTLVIPGAQDVETFVSLLTRVRERLKPMPADGG